VEDRTTLACAECSLLFIHSSISPMQFFTHIIISSSGARGHYCVFVCSRRHATVDGPQSAVDGKVAVAPTVAPAATAPVLVLPPTFQRTSQVRVSARQGVDVKDCRHGVTFKPVMEDFVSEIWIHSRARPPFYFHKRRDETRLSCGIGR
jgi:hypothetical protein